MHAAVNEAADDFEFEPLEWARRYRDALIREFFPHLRGHVVEVGAGIGQMTGLLARVPGVEHVLAIEPDARFGEKFRQRLPDIPLLQGTIKDLAPGLRCDCLVSVNVLEHIENDQDELHAYFRLLREAQGTLCLFVPARPEIYSRLDRDFGHYRRYTAADLRGKLVRAGFKPLRLHYFNLAGYFGWWFNFCLLRKRRFDPAVVRFFDRVIFPLVHAGETRILRPPFGQSLLVLAQAEG